MNKRGNRNGVRWCVVQRGTKIRGVCAAYLSIAAAATAAEWVKLSNQMHKRGLVMPNTGNSYYCIIEFFLAQTANCGLVIAWIIACSCLFLVRMNGWVLSDSRLWHRCHLQHVARSQAGFLPPGVFLVHPIIYSTPVSMCWFRKWRQLISGTLQTHVFIFVYPQVFLHSWQAAFGSSSHTHTLTHTNT